MLNRKTLSVVVTAGVLACGYAIVSTNAFADSSTTPNPAVSAAATTSTTAGVTTTTPSAIVPPAAPLGLSANAGIQAPAGLQNSSTSVSATVGDDDGDDQSTEASDDDGVSDDDSSLSVTAGVTTAPSIGVTVGQDDDNQGGSGSDD